MCVRGGSAGGGGGGVLHPSSAPGFPVPPLARGGVDAVRSRRPTRTVVPSSSSVIAPATIFVSSHAPGKYDDVFFVLIPSSDRGRFRSRLLPSLQTAYDH